MSQNDQTEMRELRERLTGALKDLQIRDGTIAALRDTLRESDARLEHVTAERDRLREEKVRFWGKVLEDDAGLTP